mmetsp:Transcript_6116/g.18478  ORF Transcript_6116/g.18478 Transcript_6116/m.18478 type:complete len:116 (-) Transcript_6116:598-945(-)
MCDRKGACDAAVFRQHAVSVLSAFCDKLAMTITVAQQVQPVCVSRSCSRQYAHAHTCAPLQEVHSCPRCIRAVHMNLFARGLSSGAVALCTCLQLHFVTRKQDGRHQEDLLSITA